MSWVDSLISGVVNIASLVVDKFSKSKAPVVVDPLVRVDAEAEINAKTQKRIEEEKRQKFVALKGTKP